MDKLYPVILVLTSLNNLVSTSPINISSSYLEGSEDGCVYIEDCEPLFWMLQNIDNVENKTSEDVNDILNSYSDGCKFQKVRCPSEESEDDEDYDLDEEFETVGLRDLISNPYHEVDCDGSIRVIVLEENSVQPFRFHRNIGNFKARTNTTEDVQVVNAKVDGNCCWSMYPKKFFRGDRDDFEVSDDRPPKSDIGSLKKSLCKK